MHIYVRVYTHTDFAIYIVVFFFFSYCERFFKTKYSLKCFKCLHWVHGRMHPIWVSVVTRGGHCYIRGGVRGPCETWKHEQKVWGEALRQLFWRASSTVAGEVKCTHIQPGCWGPSSRRVSSAEAEIAHQKHWAQLYSSAGTWNFPFGPECLESNVNSCTSKAVAHLW